MKNAVTVSRSIFIKKPREEVWDYTQDYGHRHRWDASVLEANVLQGAPARVVRLRTKGNAIMTFVYKLDDRPNKTTLAAKEVISPFILSGGGSWTYEAQGKGTLWTQTNTLVFKPNLLLRFLLPVFKWYLGRQTVKAMRRAKELLEGSE